MKAGQTHPTEKKWKIFDERGYLQYMCAVLFARIGKLELNYIYKEVLL